ncbi:MAG: c-type cytochrome [Bacteroidetes bacterium]|nr:c-type cytochrome [Bacteroidota bacterium]MBS1973339.1 c-type cytochrome [Bacteroidota bacterium]
MKKTFVILSCIALATACGSGSDTKAPENKDNTAATATTPPSASTASTSPEAEKALELIGANDCTTCHKLEKGDAAGAAIGPAYSDVAKKYAPAADTTIDRIVKHVIAGGSGIWGTVPMTPHPSLKEADAKTIVKYIMTLKE